ncbi:MAG TPA: hypothetical protein VHO06_26530, partial [Polyangia bacterium]|nr:hypothetical protein [Polyangia bacterium]
MYKDDVPRTDHSAAMQRRRPRRLRDSCAFLASLVVHVALAGLVSLRSCGTEPPFATAAASARLVSVELTAVPPPRQPKTARPGGGEAVSVP